tara:strand:+ start:224 stop:472 length:249 start_codon:yes stop_codon:yes gene_type:complete
MTEEQKPYITIDDVQVYIEDLPEEGQQIFSRLQRLNQKKAVQTLDIEETQAAIGFFSNKIVEIVNSDKTNTAEVESSEEDSE